MQHPFINDLSDKSLEEIQQTITALMGKLSFAYRSGNAPLAHQLQMALESYKTEYAKKMDSMISAQKIQTKISIKKDSEK